MQAACLFAVGGSLPDRHNTTPRLLGRFWYCGTTQFVVCGVLWAFSRLALRVAVATLVQLNVHDNMYFTHTCVRVYARIVYNLTLSVTGA